MSNMSAYNESERRALGDVLKRLVAARQDAGLTQRQVARMLGFAGGPTISQLENGVRQLTLATALRLAAIYGVNRYWLITGVNPDFTLDEQTRILEAVGGVRPDLLRVLETIEMISGSGSIPEIPNLDPKFNEPPEGAPVHDEEN